MSKRVFSLEPAPADGPARERFVAAIDEGLADAAAGRVMSDEEVTRRMQARFGTTR